MYGSCHEVYWGVWELAGGILGVWDLSRGILGVWELSGGILRCMGVVKRYTGVYGSWQEVYWGVWELAGGILGVWKLSGGILGCTGFVMMYTVSMGVVRRYTGMYGSCQEV